VHLAVLDVEADLEAQGIAVEGQRGLRVVVREEAGVDRDVHGVMLVAPRWLALLDS
jgi:hypothetical protein